MGERHVVDDGTMSTTNSSIEAYTPPMIWTVSSYCLDTNGDTDELHLEHPNGLGMTEETGLEVERSRYGRFRSVYVSRDMHDAALGKSRGLRAFFLRRILKGEVGEQCRKKTCFRREGLGDELPLPSYTAVNFPEDSFKSHLLRCGASVHSAAQFYGTELFNDLQLGFTRQVSIDERIVQPPLLSEMLSSDCGADASVDFSGHVLPLVISYRHTTGKEGRILNIKNNEWHDLHNTIVALCRASGYTAFRLWTDQMLSSKKPGETLRWVSCGILPYAVYPVVYIRSSNMYEELRRMWISVEHITAGLGHGIIHSGRALAIERLPREWSRSYIEIEDGCRSVTWNTGIGMQLHQVLRRLCGIIMCGFVRNKIVSWARDAQDIIEWASAMSSTVIQKDLWHTFTCEDCRRPLGYTSTYRLMTLLSSSAPLFPENPGHVWNDTSPIPDVPAIQMTVNHGTWDGFREWVPESCLWGSSMKDQDNLQQTKNKVLRNTKTIVLSDGGPRAVAVLQHEHRLDCDEAVFPAYMLVGLTTTTRTRYIGRVAWSKRFWPVQPYQMWVDFHKVYRDQSDREALSSIADIIGASSGLDYRNISEASEVRTLNIQKVKW